MDFQIPRIAGIDDADMPMVYRLRDVWASKYPGNVLRTLYYTAHERYKDFGLSVPPRIAGQVAPMIGWPAKAVRTLSDLSAFEGFQLPSDSDMYGVQEICDTNRLTTAVSQTIVSAYTHSCAFLTVSLTEDGTVAVSPRSADWSAAIWDGLHNRIGAAMTITDTDENGKVDGFNVWLPHCLYECSRTGGVWSARRSRNPLNRPTVVPFCYDPQLDRPFGRSRISGPLMALTDIGIRTVTRMEATAEFYSAPKLWFLGVSPQAFDKDLWSSLVSVINSIDSDIDGNKPELKQVSQASMQPHSDMLKTIAMLVASETSLPVNDLGITMDNPASAEAMAAAERKLSREADRQNRLFSEALKDAMGMAVRLANPGLTSLPEEISGMRPVWAPTREVSDAARADYYAKIAGVNSAFADSDVGLMKAGLTFAEIRSFRAYQQRVKAQQSIDQLKQRTLTQRQEVNGDGSDEQASGVAGTAQTAGTGTEGLSDQSR
ncbi:phage portal protein [Bifidobacterium saguini]|nr:phage portal protein [Bifidobacterium saguini]